MICLPIKLYLLNAVQRFRNAIAMTWTPGPGRVTVQDHGSFAEPHCKAAWHPWQSCPERWPKASDVSQKVQTFCCQKQVRKQFNTIPSQLTWRAEHDPEEHGQALWQCCGELGESPKPAADDWTVPSLRNNAIPQISQKLIAMIFKKDTDLFSNCSQLLSLKLPCPGWRSRSKKHWNWVKFCFLAYWKNIKITYFFKFWMPLRGAKPHVLNLELSTQLRLLTVSFLPVI